MLDTDNIVDVDEGAERMPPMTAREDERPPASTLMVRRRIEHMRELKRLRELLEDPEFDELN